MAIKRAIGKLDLSLDAGAMFLSICADPIFATLAVPAIAV